MIDPCVCVLCGAFVGGLRQSTVPERVVPFPVCGSDQAATGQLVMPYMLQAGRRGEEGEKEQGSNLMMSNDRKSSSCGCFHVEHTPVTPHPPDTT